MAEKETDPEDLFHVLKEVVLGSKIVSAAVVKSVSNKVILNEDKTVLIELIGQPDTENKVDVVEVQVPKAVEKAAQLDTEKKVDVEVQVPKADAAQLDTEKKVDVEVQVTKADAAQLDTEKKVDVLVQVPKTDENAAQLATESKIDVDVQVPKNNEDAIQLNLESKVDVESKAKESKVDVESKANKADDDTAKESKVDVESKANKADDTAQTGVESNAVPGGKPDVLMEEQPVQGEQKRRRKVKAATKIQAKQRQLQSIKQVKTMRETMEKERKTAEQERAATLIQNVHRRKVAMKKYNELRAANASTDAMTSLEATMALQDLLMVAEIDDTTAAGTVVDLIDAKADINLESEDGYTSIALACYYQGAALVRILIEHQAELNVNGPQGDTLLIAASTRNPCNSELITLLLDYPEIRKTVNATETAYGSSALFLMCQEYNSSDPNVARCEDALRLMLGVDDIDINITNNAGVTPLMMAVSNTAYNVAQMLMDAGADANKRDQRGNTALSIADVNQDDDMWQILGGAFEEVNGADV